MILPLNGGALPWRGLCLSIFHSLASLLEAKVMLGHLRLQTRPSPPDGMGRPAPLQCELNLLGLPYGAGWVNEEIELETVERWNQNTPEEHFLK